MECIYSLYTKNSRKRDTESPVPPRFSVDPSIRAVSYGHIVYRVIAKGITLHQTPHRKNDEKIGKKKSQIMCDLQVDDDTGRTSEKARRLARKPFE